MWAQAWVLFVTSCCLTHATVIEVQQNYSADRSTIDNTVFPINLEAYARTFVKPCVIGGQNYSTEAKCPLQAIDGNTLVYAEDIGSKNMRITFEDGRVVTTGYKCEGVGRIQQLDFFMEPVIFHIYNRCLEVLTGMIMEPHLVSINELWTADLTVIDALPLIIDNDTAIITFYSFSKLGINTLRKEYKKGIGFLPGHYAAMLKPQFGNVTFWDAFVMNGQIVAFVETGVVCRLSGGEFFIFDICNVSIFDRTTLYALGSPLLRALAWNYYYQRAASWRSYLKLPLHQPPSTFSI